MLFRTRDLEAIFAGRCTLAFRRWKRPTVKVGGQVRKLKGLGLTISLDVGYRLSPRGEAVLGSLGQRT